MSQFAAEAVPSSVEAVLAEFLDRQLHAIEAAFVSRSVITRLTSLPDRPVIGAIVYLGGQDDPALNGFYGCIENSQGEGEWKKLATE